MWEWRTVARHLYRCFADRCSELLDFCRQCYVFHTLNRVRLQECFDNCAVRLSGICFATCVCCNVDVTSVSTFVRRRCCPESMLGGAKIHPWRIQNRLLDSRNRPLESQVRSKSAQERPKSDPRAFQDRPTATQERLRATQERPKSDPRAPKTDPRAPKNNQQQP